MDILYNVHANIAYIFVVANITCKKFFVTICVLTNYLLHSVQCFIYMYRMGDGAREISNAGKEVFGSDGSRLMCWAHTYRNIVPRLSALKKMNQKLQQELLHDIQSLQWSCHSEDAFDAVFDLLEDKYTQNNNFID